MFHIGHLNILRRAKDICEHLIVGVTTDELCYKRKKKTPIINQYDRIKIVNAIRYVDETVFQTNMDKLDFVRKNKVEVVFVGSDWQGTPQWNTYEAEFKKYGCDVVYLKHTDNISSSILRDIINNQEN